MGTEIYRVEVVATVYIEAQSLEDAENILLANPELILTDEDIDVEAFGRNSDE
ncbi:MAG TPA: hypothetical protein PLY43_06605 [Ruminococcus sp.]|jgi:hypothetical protein|nr:hypothetical protein [Ruminococcus sp.]